jgi:hypothetical protein
LIKAGLLGGKGVPASVKDHPQVFVTLTAPSFGAVHNRVVDAVGRVQRCHPRGNPRCRRRHRQDDPQLGAPLAPDSYDYCGAVTWNALAPQLWAKTLDLLSRQLARLAGYSLRTFAQVGRRSFSKVAEVQARGLTHYHGVVRLDGVNPDDRSVIIAPGAWASADLLDRAIRGAVAQATVASPNGTVIAWGEQLDIRPVKPSGSAEEPTEHAVAGYIAKYATKGSECAGTIDRPIFCRACDGTGEVAGQHSKVQCADCAGTGTTAALDALAVSEHSRRMIQTCWQLGGRSDLAGLRLRQWAHALGYPGHFSTKSRCYSTTLTALRSARRDYQTSRLLRALGCDPATALVRWRAVGANDWDESKVLVIGHWRYAGRGYRAGESYWAAAIAEEIATNRKLARWALSEQAAAEADLWRQAKQRPSEGRGQTAGSGRQHDVDDSYGSG